MEGNSQTESSFPQTARIWGVVQADMVLTNHHCLRKGHRNKYTILNLKAESSLAQVFITFCCSERWAVNKTPNCIPV